MSTLTHTPSPAASPRAFHSRPYSPRATPRTYAGSSSSGQTSHRAFNAPAVSTSAKQPKDHSEGNQVQVSRRTVDAGTQYSPDGYPPTAGHEYRTSGGGLEHLLPTESLGARKRKGSTRSPSPPAQQMSSTANTASSSAESTAAPNEPQLRTNPDASGSTAQSANTTDLPQRTADQEPQEARSTHGHSSAPKRSRAEPGMVKVMPREYSTCNPKDLGVLISSMLMELIRLNDQIPLRDGKLTRFHSRAPPGISVSDYLQRLIQHATLSPPIMLSMVYYIDRLCAMYSAFTINSLTVHRFLITAGTVAAKGLSDSFWTNPTYARIGGIPVSELATLELEFLQKVQWKIVPKPEVLEEYYCSLVERTDGYELEPLGSASGSESSSLDESDDEINEDEKMDDAPT